MVTVTKQAKEELMRIVESRGLKDDRYLRLATPPLWVGEGDWGIVISGEGASDYTVEHQGQPVLLIETSVAERMSTAILDFKDSPEGSRFTLDVY